MSRDLFDDLKVKNAVAKSARTKVSGKGRYMMPSDYLSATEKKKLNGEITVYEMKKPISWKKFKSYPKDIQREYLQWFVDEFGVTRGALAPVLGVTVTGMYPYFKQQGFLDMFPKVAKSDAVGRLNVWLEQFDLESKNPVVEEPVIPEKKDEKVSMPSIFFNTISSCEMNLQGSASQIAQTLFNLFQNQEIAVSVIFAGVKTEVEHEKVD